MNWRRNLWILAVAVMMSGASYTMLVPFLPLYLLEIGVPGEHAAMWSGIIFSVSFLIGAIMAPYWGRCADNSGKRRMILRAGFSLSVVYFLGGLVHNPWELLGVRVLQGFANGFVPAAMAIVASSTPKENLGASLGFMQAALLIGGILGPLLGGSLAHVFGMRLSFTAAAVIIFCSTLAVALLVTEPEGTKAEKGGSIRDDFAMAFTNRRLIKLLLLLMAVQTVSMTLQPLVTLYVAQLAATQDGVVLTAGIVYSMAGISGALAAPLWGKSGQTFGFPKILAAAFLGAGLFNSLQYLAADIYQFAVLQFCFGFCIVGVFPAINTLIVNCTAKDSQGRVFGLTTTVTQLGSMFGPLLGGSVSSVWGIPPVFLLTGTALLLLGAAAVRRAVRREKQLSEAS